MKSSREMSAYLAILCFFVFITSCSFIRHEDSLPEADAYVYPETVFSGVQDHVCIDISGENGVRSAYLDDGTFGKNRKFSRYTNSHGQQRLFTEISIPEDISPGIHPVRVRLETSRNTFSSIELSIEVKKTPRTGKGVLSANAQDEIERLSCSRIREKNRIRILNSGKDAFDAWKDVLLQAEEQINLQTYYLDDSGLCRDIIDIIEQKASEGVEVNILITRYSQLGKSPLVPMKLRHKGIKVILAGDIGFPESNYLRSVPWLDRMKYDYRIFQSLPKAPAFKQWAEEKGDGVMVDFALHEKMVTVDGKIAIMGGRNLSDCYFWWWHDMDALVQGPVVGDINSAFERNWLEFGGRKPRETSAKPGNFKDGVSARLVQSTPWHGQYHNLDMVCAAIDSSEKSLYMTSQYLALPPRLNDAIMRAARRGVDVRILTNSYTTGQEVARSLCHFISMNYYRDLLRAGVRIYEYQPSDPKVKLKPYLHAKQIIIDGKWLSMGSFNLSIRSSYLESELMLNIHDSAIALEQEAIFLDNVSNNGCEVSAAKFSRREDNFSVLMSLAKRIEILY